MTIFITRPAPDAERTVDALRAEGIEAEAAPLMDISFTDAALPEIPEDALLAFTSANGVRAWVAAGGPALPVFAVGDATANTAAEYGLPIEGIASGDVEALFILLDAEAAGRSILHVRGQQAIGNLCDRLGEAGHSHLSLPLYEAVAAPKLPPNLKAALEEGGHAVGIFSPRSMKLFLDLVEAEGLTARIAAFDAICLSPAVAEIGKSSGFRSVHVAQRPELSAFVDTARLRRT
ncbi:uroporphyrinogen-III synthase [Parvularcula marina]|uniref:uroporphyrinogen-III synthase n=1 Tax=Parvularcula marina TaxID=2292771 RepID=UPI003512880A